MASPPRGDDDGRKVDYFDVLEEVVKAADQRARAVEADLIRRVVALEEDRTWATRLVVGTVLMGLVGLLIKAGGVS